MAELRADREVADRKVESLQMTLAALKDDHERLKGSEASLRTARANLKDREEKLRAMSKQLEAARCVHGQPHHHVIPPCLELNTQVLTAGISARSYGRNWVANCPAIYCSLADDSVLLACIARSGHRGSRALSMDQQHCLVAVGVCSYVWMRNLANLAGRRWRPPGQPRSTSRPGRGNA